MRIGDTAGPTRAITTRDIALLVHAVTGGTGRYPAALSFEHTDRPGFIAITLDVLG